jgi:hypothetical protein
MKHIITQNTENATNNIRSNVDNTLIERGDRVMARVASGRWVERRVWSVGDAVVYLCSERLYGDLLKGASRLWPIGFPKADIRGINEATSI